MAKKKAAAGAKVTLKSCRHERRVCAGVTSSPATRVSLSHCCCDATARCRLHTTKSTAAKG
jgi:hypothetical protein